MRFNILICISIAACFIYSCKQEQEKEVKESEVRKYNPAIDLGGLFHDIQTANIFADSKLFVDAVPKSDPKDIVKLYGEAKLSDSFDLAKFVNTHFNIPLENENNFKSDTKMALAEHIDKLWQVLTQQANSDSELASSLLVMPKRYIVPGGRFREIYYWDSYFTMLGLKEAGKTDLIQDMVDNFAYLIDTYGHIPNGNRSYYLSRSQPPFFTSMVELLSEVKGEQILNQYLPQIEKEYQFWMKGSDILKEGECNARVCLLKGVLVNRYFDNLPAPRPEAYKEDIATASESNEKEKTYLNLKAGAESGWDYSTRWFKDGKDLKTIATTEIVPVDLNSLLYNTEQLLADIYSGTKDVKMQKMYAERASKRQNFINETMWDDKKNIFADVWINDLTPTVTASMAMMYPLFYGLADEEKAQEAIGYAMKNFLKSGGFATTENQSGQQWDYPNGWAPLQWIGFQAMINYGFEKDAKVVAQRWTSLNERVFKQTGKMLEKYNVVDMQLKAGGGEYPVQDGFGWSNGVYMGMKKWLDANDNK